MWYSLITRVDFIGHLPTLKLDGRERNQTIFGGILCLLIYGIFIVAALYFGQELVYRDIPTVIATSQLISSSDYVTLGKGSFNFFIGLRNPSSYLNIEDFFVFQVGLYSDKDNGDSNIINIKTKKCSTDDISGYTDSNSDNTFKTIQIDQFICLSLDSDSIQLKGPTINQGNNYLQFKIIAKDVGRITKNMSIVTYFVDTLFNMRKFNNFGTYSIYKRTYKLDKDFTKYLQVFLKLVTHKTDIGYMFEDFHAKNYHQIKEVHLETTTRPADTQEPLFELQFFLNQYKDINFRKYYKFQNWVAELGGIVRALTLCAFVLNYFIDQATYYEKMINSLFDVDDVIKYFQYSPQDQIGQGKKKPRDSVVLCSVKKEKTYFEKEYQQFYNYGSELPLNNYFTASVLNKRGMRKTSLNEQKSGCNNNNTDGQVEGEGKDSRESSEQDPHDAYISSLKANKAIKEHFEKVKKSRFRLSPWEVFVYCFKTKKESPKYNSYIGGRSLIRERADIIYILRKNLQFDRFKNLILRDYQLLLLNSLTKFMLDPERVNLCTFESCHYEKFIDAFDNVASGNNIIDAKLSKWVETKFKFKK